LTAGTGWIQQKGGEKQEIKPGDVTWIPPGVQHWHGAIATNGMTHIAIQAAVDGKNVDWIEKVSEEEYNICTSNRRSSMRVGILGSGLMGGKLGTIFARAGHEVVFSYVRSEQKLKALARDAKGKGKLGKAIGAPSRSLICFQKKVSSSCL
jgi:hypothetical protein